MILADTDVIIDHFAGRQPSKARIIEYLQTRQLQTTAINYFELLSGATGERANEARQFLAAIPVLPLDREAADRERVPSLKLILPE
jgi:predicted nucleic acid-binding protein